MHAVWNTILTQQFVDRAQPNNTSHIGYAMFAPAKPYLWTTHGGHQVAISKSGETQ
jgi:hypothetical protein